MSSEIRLRKPGEAEDNMLPRGVKAIVVGQRVIFGRMQLGRWIQLPDNEQKRLTEKHVKK